MVNNNSPIDWPSVLKITNNKPELAKEMVAMLGAELPDIKQIINQAYLKKDYSFLLEQVHKLHGSCCYCGVHHLKTITADLEMYLKQQQYQNLPLLIQKLNNEIDHILNYINEQHHHYES